MNGQRVISFGSCLQQCKITERLNGARIRKVFRPFVAQATPSKKIRILAGPNGAGKTTFATEFLVNEADSLAFVNADLIASGLNPFQPERSAVHAGRLMLNLIDTYVKRGESFAFETTLSGRNYARMIPHWQAQGYWIQLYLFQPT